MSDTTPPSPNEALEEILNRYGLIPERFHKLRADSYERVLAGHSLEQLDLFYALLLDPKLSNQERAAQSPYWPQGTKLAGEPPSEWLVRMTRMRMMKERTLNNTTHVTEFIDHMREKLGTESSGNQKAVLNAVLDAVGEEMLIAKLEGGSVIENREAAQLLLFAQAAKDKAEAENRKLALKEHDSKRKDVEVKLAVDKFERETCLLFIKWHANRRAREIAESNISNEEKIQQLRLTFFADVDALEQSGQVELPPR